MFRIAVPIMVTSPEYDRDAVLRDLRRARATRVFLAVPPFDADEKKQEAVYGALAREIPFYRENGIEVGVWFWTFWAEGGDFVRQTGISGAVSPTECCPLDPAFLAVSRRHIARIASMHPDLIQFDDDFRLGMQNSGRGCVCPLHRKKIAGIAGEELPAGGLPELLLGGKPNRFRSAFLRANGDSLCAFARSAREAVDGVDPSIRMGQCACIGTYDLDGTDSFEISRILAGGTKPFLRLIGAPYWAAQRNWGNRLQDVIDLERMQSAWRPADDIEIFSEGDAYPRPRFRTPASYVELFDAALRADGTLDGILKYMADYTSSASYETGYFDRHAADEDEKRALFDSGRDLDAVGIRVWVPMKSAESADYTGLPADTAEERFFPRAPRSLACSAIPVTYRGTGVAGIAFGEDARHLPDGAFSRPLILDARAAAILTEQGRDVGVSVLPGTTAPRLLKVPAYRETVALTDPAGGAVLAPEGNARVLAVYEADGKEYPFCVAYENAAGGRYLIFGFDAGLASEELWRNYVYPRLIRDAVADFGSPLPAVCPGNPDLYMICKEKNGKRLVALFNCFADEITDAEVGFDVPPVSAVFHRTTGHVSDEGIVIDRIPAFGYVFAETSQS